jgi:hypothetical protein
LKALSVQVFFPGRQEQLSAQGGSLHRFDSVSRTSFFMQSSEPPSSKRQFFFPKLTGINFATGLTGALRI